MNGRFDLLQRQGFYPPPPGAPGLGASPPPGTPGLGGVSGGCGRRSKRGSGGFCVGGGSGGGIYIASATALRGVGLIRAAGDANWSGGGGGGRVAVYAADLSGFDTSKVTAPGGTQTLVRTLEPLPLAPAARETVTVTVPNP